MPVGNKMLLIWRVLMNDIFDRNHRAVLEENDNFCAERIASVAEKAFGFAVDTSADIDAGADYLAAMEKNLAVLKAALQ